MGDQFMICAYGHPGKSSRVLIVAACLLAETLALICAGSSPAHAAEVWEKADLVQPEELAATLNDPNQEKPAIVFVGFDFLFRAAHIPGSLNVGPGAKPSGIEGLKRWAGGINKNKAVVLYCGCCPWRQCPNVRPAFEAARLAGLKNVKVLYVADSLVRDWIDKGYPVEKGH
jgi:thiosulfate/3-mercaptopyruvate sulfurtransferase